jgi:ABC-2 type transport system ATP-binding protein
MSLLARDLRKSYGAAQALRGIDLALRGGIVALLGPNGSGKTTLLRCLATSLRPGGGEIRWRGRPVWPDPRSVRASLGYLPQELDFPGGMTPSGLLGHLGSLKGCDPAAIEPLLARLGLGEVAHRPFAALSSGQVRLAGIAQALLGDPELLLLDEPTRGLDVAERERLFRELRRLAPRGLVLFSTQVTGDVPRVAQEVVVLRGGRVAYAGAVEELRHRAAGHVHEVRVPAGEALPPTCRITRRVEGSGGTTLRVIGPVPWGWQAIEVEPTLEEAFLLVVGPPTYLRM